jgi:hypothetical protein
VKTLFYLLVLTEACLCLIVPLPILVNEGKFQTALLEWIKKPLPENENTLRVERVRFERKKTAGHMIIAGLLAANTVALLLVGRRMKKNRNRRQLASRSALSQ